MSEEADVFGFVLRKLNELERRINNLIIPGCVESLSDDGQKVRVRHGSCLTPFIKWVSPHAGGISEYRAPSSGEQCLLLNLTGGDDTTACFALMGVHTNAFPLPSDSPAVHKRIYPNGTAATHDSENNTIELSMVAGVMNITIPDQVNITTKLAVFSQDVQIDGGLLVKGNIKSDGDVTDKHNSMDSMRDVYHGHNHDNNVPPPKAKMK